MAGLRDRIKTSLFALFGAADPRAPYRGVFGATVVAQGADTVDLRLDDPGLPGMSALPVKIGLPGSRATWAAGARMLMAFENGDPAKPIAIGGWDSATGAVVLSLTLGSPLAVEPLIKGATYRAAQVLVHSAIATALTAAAGAFTALGQSGAAAPCATAASVILAFEASSPAYLSTIVKTA